LFCIERQVCVEFHSFFFYLEMITEQMIFDSDVFFQVTVQLPTRHREDWSEEAISLA